MKSLRLAAALAILLVSFSAKSALASYPRLVPHHGPKPPGQSAAAACFDVYCDGVDSGWTVCGNELGPIIDAAVSICNAS